MTHTDDSISHRRLKSNQKLPILYSKLNYFDIWTKIVKSVGLEELAFTDVFDESRVENGRKLVKIERGTR